MSPVLLAAQQRPNAPFGAWPESGLRLPQIAGVACVSVSIYEMDNSGFRQDHDDSAYQAGYECPPDDGPIIVHGPSGKSLVFLGKAEYERCGQGGIDKNGSFCQEAGVCKLY